MSFILTLVSEGAPPDRLLTERHGPLVAKPVAGDLPYEAGYRPGLSAYLGREVGGQAFQIVVPDADGYAVSNPLFQYPEDEDQPARLLIPVSLRESFDAILREAVDVSPNPRP